MILNLKHWIEVFIFISTLVGLYTIAKIIWQKADEISKGKEIIIGICLVIVSVAFYINFFTGPKIKKDVTKFIPKELLGKYCLRISYGNKYEIPDFISFILTSNKFISKDGRYVELNGGDKFIDNIILTRSKTSVLGTHGYFDNIIENYLGLDLSYSDQYEIFGFSSELYPTYILKWDRNSNYYGSSVRVSIYDGSDENYEDEPSKNKQLGIFSFHESYGFNCE